MECVCLGRRACSRKRHVPDLDPLYFFLSTGLAPCNDPAPNRRDEAPAVELLRSTANAIWNVDLENVDGRVATAQHGGLSDSRFHKDFSSARGFLSGLLEKLWTFQSR